jgi:uncharacterized protein involved in exopolysaccharide biosynthesis
MNYPENISEPSRTHAGEIDLAAMGRIIDFILHRKLLFLVGFLLAVIAGATYMRVAAPTHQAGMVLLPNPNENSSTSARTSGIGGLLSVGFGNSGTPTFVKFVDTLTSYRLAERLQERHGYLQRAFANQWDTANKRWVERTSIVGTLHHLLTGRPWSQPDVGSLAQFLKSQLSVEEDKSTHALTITLKSADPALAVDLLRDIRQETDSMLREDSRAYTENAIAYLDKSLPEITTQEHRRALTDLLIEYERQLILVSQTDSPFAVIVVDPPTLAPAPVSPKLPIVYAVCVLLSVVGCSLIARWLDRRA